MDICDMFEGDPVTGQIWRARYDHEGQECERIVNGHRTIRFMGKRIKSENFIWFIYYGRWPDRPIVHINGVKTINRITNLKLTDRPSKYHKPVTCTWKGESVVLGYAISKEIAKTRITHYKGLRKIGIPHDMALNSCLGVK